MKFKTFYSLFYAHRINKAKIFLKIYIYLSIYFKYLVNLFFVPKKMNLDQKKFSDLFLSNDLTYLFNYFNSDKGSSCENQYVHPIKRSKTRMPGHQYSKIYEKYFFKKREMELKILEIGSFYGNASAALFFYFKNSNIYAGDIFPDLFRYNSKRIKNFYVDTSNEKSIKKNIEEKFSFNFDIIIEDASHYLKDQIISLFILFKKLNKGGLFVIEELDFPDTKEFANKYFEKPTLKEILIEFKKNKQIIDSKYINKLDKDYFINNVEYIEIYKGNFNEVAIIKKKI